MRLSSWTSPRRDRREQLGIFTNHVQPCYNSHKQANLQILLLEGGFNRLGLNRNHCFMLEHGQQLKYTFFAVNTATSLFRNYVHQY